MVRENRVFRTQAQKVSYEDILRALRVSSFFSFEMLVDSDEYILRSSSEEWVSFLKFSISCSYGSPPNFILWRVYICEHW